MASTLVFMCILHRITNIPGSPPFPDPRTLMPLNGVSIGNCIILPCVYAICSSFAIAFTHDKWDKTVLYPGMAYLDPMRHFELATTDTATGRRYAFCHSCYSKRHAYGTESFISLASCCKSSSHSLSYLRGCENVECQLSVKWPGQCIGVSRWTLPRATNYPHFEQRLSFASISYHRNQQPCLGK